MLEKPRQTIFFIWFPMIFLCFPMFSYVAGPGTPGTPRTCGSGNPGTPRPSAIGHGHGMTWQWSRKGLFRGSTGALWGLYKGSIEKNPIWSLLGSGGPLLPWISNFGKAKNSVELFCFMGAPMGGNGGKEFKRFVGFSCICNNILWYFWVCIIPKWLINDSWSIALLFKWFLELRKFH